MCRPLSARGSTHGLYHVLHGLISPWHGVGAEQLCIKELLARLGTGEAQGGHHGDEPHCGGRSHGYVPCKADQTFGHPYHPFGLWPAVGASLEYTDETTLYRALSGRGEL